MGFNSFVNNNNKVNHHNHDNNYGNYISILSQNYRDGQIFQSAYCFLRKTSINIYYYYSIAIYLQKKNFF